MHAYWGSIALYLHPPKKQLKQVTKKHFKKAYRDGIPKKQPNKVGTNNTTVPLWTPPYIFRHFSNHMRTTIPYMPHQPYPQPINDCSSLNVQHTRPHTITYHTQQHTIYCPLHILPHTPTNPTCTITSHL